MQEDKKPPPPEKPPLELTDKEEALIKLVMTNVPGLTRERDQGPDGRGRVAEFTEMARSKRRSDQTP